MPSCVLRHRIVSSSIVLALAVAAPSAATPIECQNAVTRAGTAFVKANANALAKCGKAVVRGRIAGPCPDGKASTAIAKGAAKLRAAIAAKCGGDDQICAENYAGEDTPKALGWPLTCPNLVHGDCTNTITHCGDIATCLACIGSAAVEQSMDLVVDALALPSTGQLALCQATIGRATGAFLSARTKALQTCWEARRKGRHADDCVPPAVGDGKYLDAIARAASKQRVAICKACGGADQACGTPDDLTPSTIGFPNDCPAVSVPDGVAWSDRRSRRPDRLCRLRRRIRHELRRSPPGAGTASVSVRVRRVCRAASVGAVPDDPRLRG